MKKAAAIAAVTAALGAGSVALATPAQALPPGEVWGFFITHDQCVQEGDFGFTNGDWEIYNCTMIGGGGEFWVLRVVLPR